MSLVTYAIMFPEEEIDDTNILYIFVGLVVLNLFKKVY